MSYDSSDDGFGRNNDRVANEMLESMERTIAAHDASVRKMRSRVSVEDIDAPIVRDADTLVKQLKEAGGLKPYKPDAVARADTDAMPHLSLSQLESLLKQQESTLRNTKLIMNLPDKGEKIRVKIREIQEAIVFRKKRDEAEMEQMNSMMSGVQLENGGDSKESEDAASSLSTFASPYANHPVARRFDMDVNAFNTRLQEQRDRDKAKLFKSPPIKMISMEEASKLINIKNQEWSTALAADELAHADRELFRDPVASGGGADSDDEDDLDARLGERDMDDEDDGDDEPVLRQAQTGPGNHHQQQSIEQLEEADLDDLDADLEVASP